MEYRVNIQWTESARQALGRLPKKVRKGLIEKIDELQECDPRQVHKPLIGVLQGYRRVVYGRYRAIYCADAEEAEEGQVIVHITVIVVAAGIRKESDKQDVYRVATKLVELGLISTRKKKDDD